MAAILQHQPLTIKQQVEELKNWHKQQQNKVGSKTNIDNYKGSSGKKDNNYANPSHDLISNNFDEIPIKVSNSNFKSLVENNVAPVDSQPLSEIEKLDKPKFKFLKRGEGIARFNMGPPKIIKKIPQRNRQVRHLKLNENTKKSDDFSGSKHLDPVTLDLKNVDSRKGEDIPTLKAPDVKLNFTWKSILSGGNPEAMLEEVIRNNNLEKLDPNSSIDSSTASLMEKILAIGKNRLSRDREELRVFEAVEQHILDSSFCSTSSYVNKLMENAVISTPVKGKFGQKQEQRHTESLTTKNNNQLPVLHLHTENEENLQSSDMGPRPSLPSFSHTFLNTHEKNATREIESNEEAESFLNKNGTETRTSGAIATWTKPITNKNEESDTSVEISLSDIEESVHVKFADEVDYKSFVEQSESVDSESLREDRISKFDESQEWNEESNSCCSQCSNHESDKINTEEKIPQERLQVCDDTSTKYLENNEHFSHDDPNSFPPLLLSKLKELEDEIKTFREENRNIKTLRESLERERKQVQEEKRRLNLERKKLQKEVEEQKSRLTNQIEEEKQKLSKEKLLFEKYSKSLAKNPTREERKEIQALREQLTEIKEELNKKESRWGAAQARVRNQVKVLEEDNKKLRIEIEDFRKQARYWNLLQKKKGKPFNNTKLIHAISEHISNIVLDDVTTQDQNRDNGSSSLKNSSASKNSTQSTYTDVKNMYGVKLQVGNGSVTLPIDKSAPSSDTNHKHISEMNAAALSTVAVEDNLQFSSDSCKNIKNISREHAVEDERTNQNESCLQKLHLEKSSEVIKEVIDGCGNAEITFPNGNIKKINKITGSEKYIYVNGDVEEIASDGTIKYYFSESRIWHTTLPDGLEIVDFPDGKIEKKHIDGTVEIVYSNNNKKITYPNGTQEILYSDGTRLRVEADKTQILTFPNGQKEIHTAEWKRREYPDGTTKTLYPDGTTETVYSNGRVRLKDKYGNLMMDSGTQS